MGNLTKNRLKQITIKCPSLHLTQLWEEEKFSVIVGSEWIKQRHECLSISDLSYKAEGHLLHGNVKEAASLYKF